MSVSLTPVKGTEHTCIVLFCKYVLNLRGQKEALRIQLQCQEITKDEQKHFNVVLKVHNILTSSKSEGGN